MAACPCGSKLDEGDCCGPLIAGTAIAKTAEALMRSRYSAYVRGAIDYIIATHDEKTRGEIDRPGITAWSKDTEWQGLDIMDTKAGGEADTTGVVEFIAKGVTNGKAFAQRERSRFAKVDDRWFYIDGIAAEQPQQQQPVRVAAVPGRNEPCSCGSGKKYKKCHGA